MYQALQKRISSLSDNPHFVRFSVKADGLFSRGLFSLLGSPVAERHGWVWRWNQHLTAYPPVAKYLLALALVGAVGGLDFFTGAEISLSVCYLLPVAYAAWFIRPRAGLAVAIIS